MGPNEGREQLALDRMMDAEIEDWQITKGGCNEDTTDDDGIAVDE